MSSYFKTGTEVGKSNGFIKELMKCRSHVQMYYWFKMNKRQVVLDDINYYSDKYDLTLPENANLLNVINKLKDMIS